MIKSERGVTEMRAANEPELLIDFACIVNAMKDALSEEDVRMAFKLGMLSDEELEEVGKEVNEAAGNLINLIRRVSGGVKL